MDKDLIEQYKLLHKNNNNYGSGSDSFKYIDGLFELIKSNNIKHVMDFGCGKGFLIQEMKKNGITCTGYDPAVKEFDIFPSDLKDIDLVVSTDVFEHLNEDCMHEDFDLIKKCNPNFLYFNIATQTAVNKLPNGMNCHTKKNFENFKILKKQISSSGAPSVIFVLCLK